MSCYIFVNAMAKFPSGQVVATPAALEALENTGESASTFLDRHFQGDWGNVDPEDKQSNDDALKNGDRILSVYHLKDQTKIYIITEWDRSATTILTPADY